MAPLPSNRPTRMWSTCLPTILGSCMERQSSRIQAGIRSPEFFGAASDSRSVSDSELATSEDLDGAGITGDTTGTDIAPCTTITPLSRTAVPLIAAVSITRTSGAELLAAETRSAEAELEAPASTGVQRRTFSREHAPVRSAVLTMVEMSGDFPRNAAPASAEVPVVVVVSTVVADAINRSRVVVAYG